MVSKSECLGTAEAAKCCKIVFYSGALPVQLFIHFRCIGCIVYIHSVQRHRRTDRQQYYILWVWCQ